MNLDEAIQLIANVSQDFVQTLPQSAKEPMIGAINEAIKIINNNLIKEGEQDAHKDR